jgi:multicomponent Na+:H+ antiporter subunit D
MPWTLAFCVVGSASISAFPLFSGFVTKTMILAAAAEQGLTIPYLILLFASAGVFHHSGIKIPFFAFFAHDSGKRPQEAPLNMLVAMGIAAALCIGIGVYPDPLYALLPFPVDYNPYTLSHVVTDLQLLMFSALAFSVLQRTGLYPPELKSTVLDTDWFYRRFGIWLVAFLTRGIVEMRRDIVAISLALLKHIIRLTFSTHGPEGFLARTNGVGVSVAVIVTLLTVFVLVFYMNV